MKLSFRRKTMGKIGIAVVIIVALLILAPVATIWSLNTLFPMLNIPVTFETWCASLVLGGVVGGSTGLSFKK
jgi:hypothetical protein